MNQPAPINTILYLAIEHCCPDRNINLEFRVGATAGPNTNPICYPGPTQRSGWYKCTTTLTGSHVSVNQVGTNCLQVREMLAYSGYTI